MDRLPLVPENGEDHDILPLITEVFQETLRAPTFPTTIAANYAKYQVDPDFTELQSAGLTTVKILQALDTRLEDVTKIEREILTNHALAMIQKRKNLPIFDELRLKRHEIFRKLSNYTLETYELIQRKDLYPNPIKQYLDFTYNPTLHTCIQPCPPPQKRQVPTLHRRECGKVAKPANPPRCPFKADPAKINFYNYEVGKTSQGRFKLRNVTQTLQCFSFVDFPKESAFRLKTLSASNKIAPGMCAEFLVTFQPEIYKNRQEFINFKTATGVGITVPVMSFRDPPKLDCYVVNQRIPWFSAQKPNPGSKCFSEIRQRALNFTVDCGSCWLGGYALSTMIMKNKGPKGRFFITTENEWMYDQLNDSSTRSVELIHGAFTIFPTFFEIETGEVGQIFILFRPDAQGFHNEKLLILCDNNTHQDVVLLGDCMIYAASILTINLYLMEDTFRYNRRAVRIKVPPYQKSSFILSIVNNSPIHLPYFWALKTNFEDGAKKKLDPDWIEVLHNTRFLHSFSTTDVVVQLTPQTNEEGSYYTYLSLYLTDIPMQSITDDKFIIRNGNRFTFAGDCDFMCEHGEGDSKDNIINEYKLADVHIFQLGIFCKIEIPLEESPVGTNVEHIAVDSSIKQDAQKLRFSKAEIIFGVMQKGVKIRKTVTVRNLTDRDVDWTIKELSYRDSRFYVFAKSSHISPSGGTLRKKSKVKLRYGVEATEVSRWVSILCLFSCPACTCQNYTVEDLCLVACEVTEPKISVKTDNDTSVVCPKDVIFVGIPTVHTIYVHNHGVLTGCFYFLKPTGSDGGKVRARFLPQSGVVLPGATTPIKMELVVLEQGILEDVHIPCFVGDPERLISLPILCGVFGFNVQFHLPNRDGGYERILWPPKTDLPCLDSNFNVGEDDWSARDADQGNPISSPAGSLTCLIADDSIAATYPTVKTKPIRGKTPTRLSFYFENLTPLKGGYTVNPSNYGPDGDCFNHVLVKAKMRTAEFFWEKACLDGSGIVIEPERRSGDIVPYEVVEIHLWIYANTWGKYLEEVMIEIDDLAPFCFNLVVDVVGLPVEFPFARNTTLACPTIRFENVAYATKELTKSFTVTNISAIPVQVNWNLFTAEQEGDDSFNLILEFEGDTPKLTIPKKFHGYEICGKCFYVDPCETFLDAQATATVRVTLSADGFVPHQFHSTNLRYKIVGFIGLESRHRFKENYFKRGCGTDFPAAKIEVLATLEMPVMQVDLSSDETKMDLFVNDILLTDYKFPQVYLLLRNVDKCAVQLQIDIDRPFEIIEARTVPTAITDRENLILQRHECLQVMVTCRFSSEELMDYADLIYQRDDTKGDVTQEFVSVVTRDLNVHQKGLLRQMIQFQVRLHFPRIVVKPNFLKFGHCLLYRTKKAMFTIYNMTGSITTFEIFKSTKLDYFEVHPNGGEIPRSTGLNRQFVDVAVYFTPTRSKLYLGSLRILTNLPQYYFDVTLTGHGTTDEKFNVD